MPHRAQPEPVVIGGPDPRSSPDVYRHSDFLVLGGAEDIIQEFVDAYAQNYERLNAFISESSHDPTFSIEKALAPLISTELC